MFDPSTPAGARALARLAAERVIWLTTVTPAGQPQASPVWFLFADGEFLIYSLPDTARTRNLAANPRVSLHLDGNGRGGDIVSIEGTARVDPEAPPSSAVAAYQDRYSEWIARNGWTPESFARDYPIAVRILPTRVRAW
ncbi:MAG: TIGR03667 family PPOX class F420-dependent oxidoreductase [Acidimicrobiia bacterium]|jgi:PPOX class probable F420-dependent enzyme|nr:TIGR03667 family PPOX class F420-dependent oxidoreductase [Acidimicrobiia bacterium]